MARRRDGGLQDARCKRIDGRLSPAGTGVAADAAAHLELSLDKAASVMIIRHATDVCTVYIGDPAGPLEELNKIGTIAIPLANEMLELTHSGVNQMQIGDQVYRFVRTFREVGDAAAVVFFNGPGVRVLLPLAHRSDKKGTYALLTPEPCTVVAY